MLLARGVLLLFINRVLCVSDDSSRSIHVQQRLKTDLLSNYDGSAAPSNITSTGVDVHFILKQFYYDSEEVVFSIFCIMLLSWRDGRLAWNPTEYDDILEINMRSYLIWTPDLQHQNMFEYDDFYNIYIPRCTIKSYGRVECLPHVSLQTECISNLTGWPYDTQSCTFKFAEYNNKGNVNFTFNSERGVTMFGAEYGNGWNIIDFDQGEDPKAETQLYFTFVVERQGAGLAAVILIPSTVLAVLTVSTLFLDVGRVRLAINVLSLTGHFYFLQEMNELIPRYGSSPPSVLHFIVASLVFTTVTIVLMFVLNILREKSTPPHQWIVLVNKVVFKSLGRLLLLPRSEALNLEPVEGGNRQAAQEWTYFADIINTFSIFIAIIMYTSAFSYLIPRPLPINL